MIGNDGWGTLGEVEYRRINAKRAMNVDVNVWRDRERRMGT
jgi:hypothetical protein